MGEVDKPYSKWDAPEFPNELLAFNFLREEAMHYAAKNDFTSPAAIKYHTTIRFLENILGKDLYQWGIDASSPSNF
jgi:hypothetical protein